MATTSGQIMSPDCVRTEADFALAGMTVVGDASASVVYRNRVWDTQVGGSGGHHYWNSTGAPDYVGAEYDGPGTWGVHTSNHCVLPA